MICGFFCRLLLPFSLTSSIGLRWSSIKPHSMARSKRRCMSARTCPRVFGDKGRDLSHSVTSSGLTAAQTVCYSHCGLMCLLR